MARAKLHDPYRRFTWGKALVSAGVPLVLLFLFAMMPIGQGGRESAISVQRLSLGLGTWWAAAVFILWWPPSPCARQVGAFRSVRFSTARRLAYVAVWLPSGLLVHQGGVHSTVALAISVVMASYACVGSAVRLEFDEREVAQTGVGRRRLRMAWSEIQLAQVFPDGVFLWSADRRSIRVNCRQVDGYPELAAAILRHLPTGTRGLDQGRAILEAQSVSAPADPA